MIRQAIDVALAFFININTRRIALFRDSELMKTFWETSFHQLKDVWTQITNLIDSIKEIFPRN